MGDITIIQQSPPSINVALVSNTVVVSQRGAASIILSQGGARGAKGLDGDAGAGGGLTLAAGAGTAGGGVVTLANSNGVSFGLTNSRITASFQPPVQSEQTQNRFNLTLAGVTAGVMGLVSSGILTLAAANNITLSQDGNAITLQGPNTHQQQTGISGISAGGNLISQGTMVLSNSNGVSFGLNGNTITASHDGLTTAAQSNHSHGNPQLALTNLSGTTASGSNGLTLSLSAAAGGGADGYNVLAAGTQTATSAGTVQFANSNGISFGMSGSSRITASHNGLTTAALSNHSHGNPFLNLTNISGTTASGSNGLTLSLSAGFIPGATVFSNSNNVSFGLNGSTVTASATWNQTLQTQGSVQVLGSSGNISFANGNGITFGGNGSTVTASHNGLTTAMASNASTGFMLTGERANYLTTAALSGHSHGVTLNLTNINATTGGNSQGINLSLSAVVPSQTVQPVAASAANGSFQFSTLPFANSNGVSFSTGTQGVFATVKTDYLTTAMQSQMSSAYMGTSERGNYFATVGNTFANSTHSHGNPALNLTNISGSTASGSNGLTLSLSAAAAGGGAGLSAGTQSVGTGTILFADSNGITFGMSGSSRITASHNGMTTAALSNHSHGNPVLNLTNINGTTGSNSNGLTLSLSAVVPAQTVQPVAVSGSNGSFNFSTLSFGNLNGFSFYTSNGSVVGSYTDAGAGGGITALHVSAGTTSSGLSSLVFSNSNGVSFGLNGITITASAAGGGGGYTAPSRNMIEIIQGERLTTVANLSATQWSRRPIFVPFWMDGSNLIPKTVRLMVSGGASSNRSLVATFGVGLYSKVNDTQLSMLASDLQAFSITASSQSTVWNGARIMDFTAMSNVTMTLEGRWVLGLYFSASTHNATFANVMLYGADNMPAISGFMIGGTTSATNNSSNVFPFWGVYSTTSTGFPDSVGMSQIYGGNSASLLDPYAIIKEV